MEQIDFIKVGGKKNPCQSLQSSFSVRSRQSSAEMPLGRSIADRARLTCSRRVSGKPSGYFGFPSLGFALG